LPPARRPGQRSREDGGSGSSGGSSLGSKSTAGEWKIAADIWNSDGAPEGMESESMTAEPEAAPAE